MNGRSVKLNLDKSSAPVARPTSSVSSNGGSSRNALSMLKGLYNTKFLLALIVLLQLVILFVIVNPINLLSQFNAVQVINRVGSLTQVPPTEIPVMAVIGDGSLPTVEDLKSQSEANAVVYKDAKDGDYVMAYSTKLVIYRGAEDKIIYDGDNPTTLLQKSQEAILNQFVAKSKEAGLIAQDEDEVPQVSLVTDADLFRQSSGSAAFYTNLQTGDVVGTYASKSLIIIYRPSTNSIVSSGSYSTSIN